jgi:hypothetical protein
MVFGVTEQGRVAEPPNRCYGSNMSAIQSVKSQYTGAHVTLDLLIDKYAELQGRANTLADLAFTEPFYELANGTQVAHPLMKSWIEVEKLLASTARELGHVSRMLDLRVEDVDDVETFLSQIERTNRPHRNVNRADG